MSFDMEGYDIDLSAPQSVTDYISIVKSSIQDYPELNKILLETDKSVENREKDYIMYLRKALAKINQFPPPTTFSFEKFPHKQYWPLIADGAVLEALKSKGLLKVRNEMPYQDQGGTSVRLEGKGNQYMQNYFSLYNSWQSSVKRFKNIISVESGYGGVYSEFIKNWH